MSRKTIWTAAEDTAIKETFINTIANGGSIDDAVRKLRKLRKKINKNRQQIKNRWYGKIKIQYKDEINIAEEKGFKIKREQKDKFWTKEKDIYIENKILMAITSDKTIHQAFNEISQELKTSKSSITKRWYSKLKHQENERIKKIKSAMEEKPVQSTIDRLKHKRGIYQEHIKQINQEIERLEKHNSGDLNK